MAANKNNKTKTTVLFTALWLPPKHPYAFGPWSPALTYLGLILSLKHQSSMTSILTSTQVRPSSRLPPVCFPSRVSWQFDIMHQSVCLFNVCAPGGPQTARTASFSCARCSARCLAGGNAGCTVAEEPDS